MELESNETLQQSYRRSRVHLSLEIDHLTRRRWRTAMRKFLLATVGLVALGMAAPASAADLAARPYTRLRRWSRRSMTGAASISAPTAAGDRAATAGTTP